MFKKKTYIVYPYDSVERPQARVRVKARSKHEARRKAYEYLQENVLVIEEA